MGKLTDNEYLQKEVIDCTYIIEEDYFSIRSSGSIWSENRRAKDLISKKELLELYKEVVTLAKEVKCSISYKYKTKQNILDNYDKSILELLNANIIYDNMLIVAKEVEQRKLHYGCSDDVKLNELHELAHKYGKIFHSSSYMEICNIKTKLEKLSKEFKDTSDGTLCKIFL